MNNHLADDISALEREQDRLIEAMEERIKEEIRNTGIIHIGDLVVLAGGYVNSHSMFREVLSHMIYMGEVILTEDRKLKLPSEDNVHDNDNK